VKLQDSVLNDGAYTVR